MSDNDIGPIQPSKSASGFSFFRQNKGQNDISVSSFDLPFLSRGTSYQNVPMGGQRSGAQSPDERSSSSKVSIFKSEHHRLKHSLLHGSKTKRVGEIGFHFFISLIAVIFLVLPILAYNLDGELVGSEEAGYGGRILRLIQYGPTIFPIIFAAITGHFLRSIALLLAERGTTLERLEQLTRSITIASTITTPYLLNSYNFLSVVLLCLWTVSPLGGQASLRILRTAFVATTSDINANYLDPFNQSSFVQIGQDVGIALTETNSIYVANLLGSAEMKAGPVDPWKNVKIPLIEAFETNSAAVQNATGWYTVPQGNVTYSSLLGNPISNLTTNFTAIVESGYATINCSFLEVIDPSLCNEGKSTDCFNTTKPAVPDWVFPAAPTSQDEAADAEYISFGYNKTQSDLDITGYDRTTPMDIIIQSRGENGTSTGHCVLSQTFLEVQVDCLNSACRASNIRRMNVGPKRPTILVDAPSFVTNNFFIWLAKVTPPGHVAYSNPSQLYILYPDDPLSMQTQWVDIATVGKELFGIRMTQLFNTFLSATYGGGLYLGSIPVAPNRTTWDDVMPVNFKTTVGKSTDLIHIYVVQRPWAAITLVASLLLLAMGIASAVIGFYTLAPDVLTSLTALANETPWFDTYKEGTTLDGDAKAAALKKRMVRLGDVKRFEEVGYIALGTIDTDAVGVGGLSTDRVYR
ncbi:hypothetical protein TWF694_003317 [Orbilia ellipsospora]|uniref:Uncharacterized protein n=1 Tax=Orbilia ellipsospora TaxID=2528407 RepID=A0AAV9X2D6_9PEZI